MSEAYAYVTTQHRRLIEQLEALSGNKLDESRLAELIDNSQRSVEVWNRVVEIFPQKDVAPTLLFDGISHLITSRCKPETAELYRAMAEELAGTPRPYTLPDSA